METHPPALLSSDGVDSVFELNKKGRRESFCQWGDGVAVAEVEVHSAEDNEERDCMLCGLNALHRKHTAVLGRRSL